MEIEDTIICAIAIGVLVSFVIYASTSPLQCSQGLMETVTFGGIFAYMFSQAGIL
ncbi:hypothetical protein Mpsy_2135 [Methanolobus psychrophilus R15]|nr:hypothetical protein Mpsy_2135 [Methanolobus psychrophilus R15]